MNLSEALKTLESYGFSWSPFGDRHCYHVRASSGLQKGFTIHGILYLASLSKIECEEYFKRGSDEQKSEREPED